MFRWKYYSIACLIMLKSYYSNETIYDSREYWFILNCFSHWKPWLDRSLSSLSVSRYTEYTRKIGAVSKVNKKFISHLTRAQRTPSAAATVQVSRALPAVRFSCLPRGRGASFQDGVAAGKGFLCAAMNFLTVWMCVVWPRMQTSTR